MSLAIALNAAGVSRREFARRAKLSHRTANRILDEGRWPSRDAEAKKRAQTTLEAILGYGWVLPHAAPKSSVCAAFAMPSCGEGGAKENPGEVCRLAGASPTAIFPSTEQEDITMLLRNESLTQTAKKHFALTRSPFADDIHTREDVFASPNIRYVRAALYDAAANHGFIAIVGESGAGKSILAEDLEQRIMDEGRPVIVVRPYVLAMEENDQKGRTLKASAIAEAIIRTLDPSATPKRTPDARFRQLHDLLKASRAAGYSHLLLIEEAHCLPIATLKHLKRFLELKQGLSRLMGIALIGQPELKSRLSEQKAEVREVVQRCELVELDPLDNDLDAYLQHKFQRAGAKSADILAADAVEAIRARLVRIPRGGKASDAVSMCYPLVVGNLLTRALNAAAAAGWTKIDAQVIGGC